MRLLRYAQFTIVIIYLNLRSILSSLNEHMIGWTISIQYTKKLFDNFVCAVCFCLSRFLFVWQVLHLTCSKIIIFADALSISFKMNFWYWILVGNFLVCSSACCCCYFCSTSSSSLSSFRTAQTLIDIITMN